jgi:hypothetical protein
LTIEEKLKYLQDASMEDARAMGNEIISEHQEALDQIRVNFTVKVIMKTS